VSRDAGTVGETEVMVPSAGESPISGPSLGGDAENDAKTPVAVRHHFRFAPPVSPARHSARIPLTT
jgi:hypothetical protein